MRILSELAVPYSAQAAKVVGLTDADKETVEGATIETTGHGGSSHAVEVMDEDSKAPT